MMKYPERARAEIVGSMSRICAKAAKLLMPNDSAWLLDEYYLKLGKTNGCTDIRKRSNILERFAQGLIGVATTMPKHTTSYLLSRAILVGCATNKELNDTLSDLEPPKFGRAARKKGEEDMHKVTTETIDLKPKRRSVARLDDANVLRIVKHVFSFVQTLSWGTKTLRRSGKNEVIEFPRLTRTHPIEVMFTHYAKIEAHLKLIKWDPKKRPPQRTTYFRIASQLTSRAEKSLHCINYVQDILINIRITGLLGIIEQVVAPTQHKKMKGYLTVAQNFLKYQYDGHFEKEQAICSHNIKYALKQPCGNASTLPDGHRQAKGIEHCPACKFVEFFMRVELPCAVKANRSTANTTSVDDALEYIEDALECFHLYQAHRVRAVNQQQAIQEVDVQIRMEVLKTKRRGTTVKITIDFKQKYLEKRLRSSQINDFGQRGITWHIVIIEYYDYEAPCEANGFQAQVVRVQVPLDQILNTGNKQDATCVLSMLEAAKKLIQIELPFVEECVLASDNANCYHHKDLIFSICFLNQLPGPKMVKIIHPETQDGKGPCDSHAAVGGTHVDRHFICSRNNGALDYNEACTPQEVANALCSNSGVKNSAVQLIELDFNRLGQISRLCAGAGEEALDYFARANEIRFFPSIDRHCNFDNLDLLDASNWSAMKPLIQVINYSNISEGAVFRVDFTGWRQGKGSFIPVVLDPSLEPDWQSQMQAEALALPVIGDAICSIAANEVAESCIEAAVQEIQAAQAGEDIVREALLDIADRRGESNGTEEELVVPDEESDDEEDDDSFLESVYAIEHAAARMEEELQDARWDPEYEYDEYYDGNFDGKEDLEASEASDVGTSEPQSLLDPPPKDYDPRGFFSGVKVSVHKRFGALLRLEEAKSNQEKKMRIVEEYESKAALDTAIGMAQEYINAPECSIRPALDEKMKEYTVADDWSPDEPLIWKQGWARRAIFGGLYGKNYMNETFKKICIDQFQRGVDDKGDKQSPNQTIEMMKELHPGLYCYPALHEVVRMYSGLGQKSKANRELESQRRESPVPPEIKAELLSLLDENPNLTGAPLFQLWKDRFGNCREYDEARIRKQAQYLRQKHRNDAKKEKKRNMAG